MISMATAPHHDLDPLHTAAQDGCLPGQQALPSKPLGLVDARALAFEAGAAHPLIDPDDGHGALNHVQVRRAVALSLEMAHTGAAKGDAVFQGGERDLGTACRRGVGATKAGGIGR